ncbi:MAG: hypothetical protein IPO08_21450 [Xanthomonadales bacterium]|nr:hypothetical protein [Xanthomonadales bacterium]
MSTEESQVSPVEETQNQATETEAPDLVTQEADADTESAAATPNEGEEADKALKRMQRRIDKQTANVYRSRAENEQLKARLQELEARSAPTDESDTSSADPMTLAREIARIDRFAERANTLVSEGSKKHADYMPALKDLAAEVGDFVQKNGAPSPFMEVVLDVADSPTELLYYLGKNPDVASDLEGLSPAKLAKQLARIESELGEKAKPKTSNAPKPLAPVKARASADSSPSDSDSTADWIKKERARMEAKGLTRYG